MGLPTPPKYWFDEWAKMFPEPTPPKPQTPFEAIVQLTADNEKMEVEVARLQLEYARGFRNKAAGVTLAKAKSHMDAINRNKRKIEQQLYIMQKQAK